jgi:hypothetical protein
MANNEFSQNFTNLLDKSMTYYDNYMVIEDLNYDLLCENKGKTLSELMELFAMFSKFIVSRFVLLPGMSDLIKESIPPPCTSRSRLSILYPCTSKRLSLKVESNLVSDRVIEDLNYDLLCENKGKTLSELMELFDLTNLVKEATCLMKN